MHTPLSLARLKLAYEEARRDEDDAFNTLICHKLQTQVRLKAYLEALNGSVNSNA